MPCPSVLFSSIFNKRWFSLAISSCWFLKVDFTGLLNFSINFSQGDLSILLERWQRGVIGKQVRLFKVIVGLFLLLFSNWSMWNCLSFPTSGDLSPVLTDGLWSDGLCGANALSCLEKLVLTSCVVTWFQRKSVESLAKSPSLVVPLGDGNFGWSVFLSWGVWDVCQLLSHTHSNHLTTIEMALQHGLKGKQ